jgi:lycopene beta-cyclase
LKFLGLEVRLARPVAPNEPVIMDATVPQRDGFRFFYLLPYAPDRMLIEDNYYSDHPQAEWPGLRAAVREYAEARGFAIAEVEREEHGVLPLPWAMARPPAGGGGPLAAGYGGGWFHPATSYSLPVAARLACHVAETAPDELFGPRLTALAAEHRRQQAFAQRLNWLLFRGTPPAGRWKVMGGFYRHPEATIRRFYALALTSGDRFRILRVGAWCLARALVRPEGGAAA